MVAHFHNIKDVIIREIQTAKKDIKIAVAWFTNYYLLEALIAKCKEGVKVELIIVYDSINFKACGLDFNQFTAVGGILFLGDPDGKMHHKFCVIDDQILINGSYNWTYWAENRNSENIVITKNSVDLIQEFNKEFEKVKQKSKFAEVVSYTSVPEVHKDGFYNIKNIVSEEYLQNIIVLKDTGKEEDAWKSIEQLNTINPAMVAQYMRDELLNKGEFALQMYQKISTDIGTYMGTEYDKLLYKAQSDSSKQNYLDAFKAANRCVSLFPKKPSIFILRGDIKAKLGDKDGADEDYNTAIRNLNYSEAGAKLIYYQEKYVYTFFPRADLYLKLGNMEMVKSTLKEAERVYTLNKMDSAVIAAKQYLQQIELGQKIHIIR